MPSEQVEELSAERTIERINLPLRVQHFALLVSVTLLIVTGLALLYWDSAFGRLLIALEGGFEARGTLHRIAAGLLIATTLYHLLYILFSRQGHEEFMQMLLRVQDFRDYGAALLYDLGLRAEKPQLDRYSYREKFQYWAFALFIVVMIGSGFVLWFHNWFFGLLPKWAFDVALAVHGGTGTLILIVLTLWHLYIVHLSPGRFPIDWSFWDGKISESQLQEEHPLEYKRLKEKGLL
ncbi:MAG: cytochrome b/b6 domain-containing protein [Candidatus Bipolaricaulota bacterium]|nr:cytochrome b/b6 domain-containing protein [Candidatus Bipolaricaulota bacterium]